MRCRSSSGSTATGSTQSGSLEHERLHTPSAPHDPAASSGTFARMNAAVWLGRVSTA